MADNQVRHIAPFINDRFLITSPWWNERINPITGETQIHRGLDIATSGSKPVYSILDGIVHSLGYDNSQGNWIIIKDDNSSSPTFGYATLYMHLENTPDVSQGDRVVKGQKVGDEGTTGQITGLHLHMEMQNLSSGRDWYFGNDISYYINPAEYMGFPNQSGISVFYNGEPIEPTKNKNKWLQFKSRKKRIIYW